MATLAAGALASILTAVMATTDGVAASSGAASSGAEAPSVPEPAVAPAPQQEPDRAKIKRMKRSKELRAGINLVGGIGLEVGAALLYLGTYGFIARDLTLTGAGCDAPDMPCRIGTPVVLLIPAGAIAMGWAGASRFAASREANLWRSPVFWVGTATLVAATLLWGSTAHLPTRNERLVSDSTLLVGGVLGTSFQIWGAFSAPLRETPPAAHSLCLAPGCTPTPGGAVCGIAVAGF
jgi:hypothetical protein